MYRKESPMKKKKESIFLAVVLAAVVLVMAGSLIGGSALEGGIVTAQAAETTPTADPQKPTPSVTPTQAPPPTPTPITRVGATPTPSPKPTEAPKPLFIVASYKGDSLPVGEELDKSLIEVMLYYSDNTSEQVYGYDLSDTRVTKLDTNRFVVIYKGLTSDFFVTGKKVVSINPLLTRYSYSVGNAPDSRDLTVTVTYSDGSSAVIDKYAIAPTAFTKAGSQELTVTYMGVTAKTGVYVEQAKTVKTLSVSYDTKVKPITDTSVDRGDLTVTALYTDYSTERITTYELLTEKFTGTGENTVKVAYHGVTAETKVEVEAKVAESIRAEYKGSAICVGEEIPKDDLKVYVTFNDGKERLVDDYTMLPTMITYVGENKIRITYDKAGCDVMVNGLEAAPPDFDYASGQTVEAGDYSITISTALPKKIEQDATETVFVKKSKLKKLMKRIGVTGEYIAFSYAFTNDDYESELPLPVRMTVPEEFDTDYTYLFYTPNMKTTAARINIEFNKDGDIDTTFYKVGTYILVYDPDLYATDEEKEERAAQK